MATVTSQLTRIHDAEGTLTTANLPAGGAGATANTDIFLQGSQSLGRRQTDTTTTAGFLLIDAADNDCSAADVHVGCWFWVTHYGILDDLRIVFGTGTGSPTNYDSHNFSISVEYPKLGGWVRGWVDVSRAPDTAGGTGLNEAQLRSYGVQVSFTTAPGGNAQNLILDAADFTNGGAALLLTGTSGLWTDFTTADENTTNQYGVMRRIGGVLNCFARVQLGSASSLAFNDSNFAIIFPQQNLVADTFMGVTIDLQHASTNIDWSSGSLKSAGAKKGDLVVTGTSGSFDASACTLDSLRIVTLTSAVTLSACTFQACGLITQSGGSILGCRIANSPAAVALLSNNPSNVSDNTFVSAGTGHAVECSATGTYTFDGNTFSGYAASDGSTGNEAFYNNSGGSVTLNITGGGTTPSVRNGTGASTTINSNVAVTVTPLRTGSEVRVYRISDGVEVGGIESSSGSSFQFSVGAGVAVNVVVLCNSPPTVPRRIENVSFTSDQNLNPFQVDDRNFLNP